VKSRAAGFSLIEAMVALAISSILVALVGSVFLVQNQFYAVQVKRSAAHDDARSITAELGRELRSVMYGGITEASNKEITIRSPIVLAAVCSVTGQNVHVQMEGGRAGLDTAEVAGIAVRNDTTGQWSYYNATWADVASNGGNPAQHCYGNGADTVGGRDEFVTLKKLGFLIPSTPSVADVLMLYRETRFKIQTSALDPKTMGLFRAAYGDTLIEYVTGLDSTAGFEYRTGGSTYATSVASGSLQSIDAVRIIARTRLKPETGLQKDVEFGWSTDFMLPNVR